MPGLHPVSVLAHEECNRRHTSRNDAPLTWGDPFPICTQFVAVRAISSACIERRRVRRESSPSNRSGKTQLIEVRRLVARDSAAEYIALPGTRGNFETLQLAQDFERAVFAADLCPGSKVLPAQQPIHELRCGHGFNLLAQR